MYQSRSCSHANLKAPALTSDLLRIARHLGCVNVCVYLHAREYLSVNGVVGKSLTFPHLQSVSTPAVHHPT